MYKNKHIKRIILLILFLIVFLTIISATSAVMYEKTEKYDSGNKIIKVNKEKFKVTWKTEQVIGNDKKYLHITYKSMKNKKDNGYVHITVEKASKNKMYFSRSSSTEFSADKIIETKSNTNKYYLKKLKPNLVKITKNSILNNGTLKFNKIRYVNRTIVDPAINETVIKTYEMNWKVYYYSKTSSIQIIERYTELKNLNNPYLINKNGLNQDIHIYKYAKGKLKIIIYPYNNVVVDCGPTTYTKYVKTNLSPKQYYLKVYKNKLETKKI